MTDTYGQNSTASSKSADLQRSLEKWLVVGVEGNSSICYNQTWKRKITPQQRSVLEHTASALRTPKDSTNANDFTGLLKSWATPLRSDGGGGARNVEIINGRAVRVSKTSGTQHGINLADESKLTVGSWITPTTKGYEVGESFWKEAKRQIERGKPCLLAQVSTSVWPTPTASDKKSSKRTTTDKQKWMNPKDPQHTAHTMLDIANLSVWPTPTARDHKDSGQNLSNSNTRKDGKTRLDTVPRIANIADQTIRMTQDGITISSGAEMKNGVQLSVEHSRWLMQLPTGYISSKLLGTPSREIRQKYS